MLPSNGKIWTQYLKMKKNIDLKGFPDFDVAEKYNFISHCFDGKTSSLKAHLHWRSLLVKPSVTATCDSNELDRMISVLCLAAHGSQGKYNSDCRVSLSLALSP